MLKNFYQIPVSFGGLVNKKKLPKQELFNSVEQHIHLILITRFGEYRFDPTFGCSVWEYDFDILPKINAWKSEMEKSISELLDKQEPRLKEVIVKVTIGMEEYKNFKIKKVIRVKRKISINVKGRLVSTNEKFERPDYEIFFSPISLD